MGDRQARHLEPGGKACWAKVNDKKNRALSIATFFTRDIADYAKGVTGNDWSKIEGQSANSAEANRKLVEKMMDDFRPNLHITVTVEGDDCDASGNALWLKYWGETVRALKANPPKGGKAQITVNVTSKARGVTAEVKDGSVFTITGSRDVEAAGWDGQIQKAFQTRLEQELKRARGSGAWRWRTGGRGSRIIGREEDHQQMTKRE